MKTSESINEIATALGKAQSEMTGAKKGAANPFFKSKYSDLSMVMEAISKPFSNNDLCFVQAAEFQDGMIAITTRIIHTSGQWLESTTCLPPVKNDAQGFGSAISYGKRYGIQALAGVPSIDDDGQAAVVHKAEVVGLSQADAKRILGDTVDTVFRHYENKDQAGIKEVLGELNPTEKKALKVVLSQEKLNIYDQVIELYKAA